MEFVVLHLLHFSEDANNNQWVSETIVEATAFLVKLQYSSENKQLVKH